MLLDSIRIKNTKKKEERDIDVILSEWFSDYYMAKKTPHICEAFLSN